MITLEGVIMKANTLSTIAAGVCFALIGSAHAAGNPEAG
jgi:hypothetical protein